MNSNEISSNKQAIPQSQSQVYIENYMQRFFAFSEILKTTNGKGAKRVLKALMGHPFEEAPKFTTKQEESLYSIGVEMKELLNVLGVQYVIENELLKRNKQVKEGEML